MDVGDKVMDAERAAFVAHYRCGPEESWGDYEHAAFDGWLAARRTPSASTGEDGLPELPWGDDFEAWLEVRTEHEASAAVRQYAREAVAADRWARMGMPKIDAKSVETRMDAGFERAHGQGVKTWQERAQDGRQRGMFVDDERFYMRAEIADLRAQLARQSQGGPLVELVAAADAVVERWHSRDWKQPHTAEFIARLTAAIGAIKFAAPPLSSEPQSEKGKQ